MKLPTAAAVALCAVSAALASTIYFPEEQPGQCVTHGGEPGRCVSASAQRCALYPTLGHLLAERPKVCQFVANDPVICCPEASVLPDPLEERTPDITPVTTAPTQAPTVPTQAPTVPTQAPTVPTQAPTVPTQAPTAPTQPPTTPTQAPTVPTQAPTVPTQAPTVPTQAPTVPTQAPTVPTQAPTVPTQPPTAPTPAPTVPTEAPTVATEATQAPTAAPGEQGGRLVGCGVAEPVPAFLVDGEYAPAPAADGRGEPAPLGRHPWTALVGLRTAEGALAWICGGALVSERLVLTAAHCAVLGGSPGRLAVRLGEHDLSTESDGATEERGVTAVSRHPEYRQPAQRHDLALLLLDRPVVSSRRVRPICLPPPAAADSLPDGTPLKLPAFDLSGDLIGSDPSGRGRLRAPAAATAPLAACAAQLEQLPHAGFIFPQGLRAESELCVARPADAACTQDSGGPLVGDGGGRPAVLLGLRLIGGCQPGQPEVALRLDHYVDYIHDAEQQLIEETKSLP